MKSGMKEVEEGEETKEDEERKRNSIYGSKAQL